MYELGSCISLLSEKAYALSWRMEQGRVHEPGTASRLTQDPGPPCIVLECEGGQGRPHELGSIAFGSEPDLYTLCTELAGEGAAGQDV